jgi:hypothetical protein
MFKKQAITIPHPTTFSMTKRVWSEAIDINRFILSGSNVQTWGRKLSGCLSFSQSSAPNQPERIGNEVVWNDPNNNQWLNAGGNYLFVDSSHSGLSMFFLVKSNQTGSGLSPRFIFDFGNFRTRGYGFGYAGANQIWCYTPSDFGGRITEKRPLDNPTSDYVVAGLVIRFGVSQSLYINNALVASDPITLSQLTAVEINEQSTPGGAGGPVTIGSGAKAGQFPGRWFDGAIKGFVIVEEAVNDFQRGWIYRYLNNLKNI